MFGKPARIDLDKDTSIDVRCQIHQMSFSPHTDAKGIMDLISFLSPKHVILVHGEKPKMAILKGRIESELEIPCFYPANNESLSIPATQTIKVDITKSFLRNYCIKNLNRSKDESPYLPDSTTKQEDILEIFRDERTAEGILMMEKNKIAKIVYQNDLLHTLDAKEHMVQLAFCCPVKVKNSLKSVDCSNGRIKPPSLSELLLRELKLKINCSFLLKDMEHLQLKSFQSRICLNKLCSYRIEQEGRDCKTETFFCCSWSLRDDNLARKILNVMREVELDMSNLELQVPDQANKFMET